METTTETPEGRGRLRASRGAAALLALAVGAGLASEARATTYTLLDRTMPAGLGTGLMTPAALGDGAVVGTGNVLIAQQPTARAVRYDAQTGITALGTLAGMGTSAANAVDGGVAVGSAAFASGVHAMAWLANGQAVDLGGSQAVGVSVQGGVATITGYVGIQPTVWRIDATTGAPLSQPQAITFPGGVVRLAGFVAGALDDSNAVSGGRVAVRVDAEGTQRAGFWENGVVTLIDSSTAAGLQAVTGETTAIDGSLVAGWGLYPGHSSFQGAFAYDTVSGEFFNIVPQVSLANPDGFNHAFARDVSGGYVVGEAGKADFDAFIWSKEGGLTILDAIAPGLGNTLAYSVNSHGTVVGSSTTGATTHAAVWTLENGGWVFTDLNAFLGAGWTNTEAYQIDEAGYIFGYGVFNGVNDTRWVLAPDFQAAVPEPGTIALASVGAAALLRRARRRRS